MKKILLLLCAMLPLCMLAVNLAELEGKWVSKTASIPINEKEIKQFLDVEYMIMPDGKVDAKYLMTTTIHADTKVYIDCYLNVSRSGQIVCEGDSVKIEFDPATIKVDFPIDEIKIRGLDEPDMESTIQEQFGAMMAPQFKDAEEQFKEPEVLNDVVVTDKKMTCKIDGIDFTFTRKGGNKKRF